MVLNLLFLVVGFAMLIAGADRMIVGATSVARKFNIPDIVIGLTIISIGTSAPEIVVNLIAAVRNEPGMVLGNVVGSNLFNVLMILGITSILGKIEVKRNTTWLEIPLSLLGAMLVFFMASDQWLDGQLLNFISRSDGIVLISLGMIFLVYNLELSRKEEPLTKVLPSKTERILPALGWIILGITGLILGGRIIVDNAVAISRAFNVSERVIAITVISVGTSLPELVTSILAVRKGKSDMAIGNVVGSNIFNVFFVLGLSAIVSPVQVAKESFPDIYLNIIVGFLLFVFLLFDQKRVLSWKQGIIFLVIYFVYMLFLLIPGA